MITSSRSPPRCAPARPPSSPPLYDWSPIATPLEAWIGGHSQRGEQRGASEPALRSLLTPGEHPLAVEGLQITGDVEEMPWTVRVHERNSLRYSVHLLVARAAEG